MEASDPQTEWARLLIDSLCASGLRDVVISPGSRSTPFVLAALEREELVAHSIVDERSAAFFALGQARASGRPSLLISTSGTASAHYLPAVVEASAACIPLLILAADRPLELHACGENQTVEQRDFFGSHLRASFELGSFRASRSALLSVRRKAVQAAAYACSPTPGPVLIHAAVQKPLEPNAPRDAEETHFSQLAQELCAQPPSVDLPVKTSPTEQSLAALVEFVSQHREGVIAMGPAAEQHLDLRSEVFRLSAVLGWPLIADATSGCRWAEAEGIEWVGGIDVLGRSPAFRAQVPSKAILQLGNAPISRGWSEWVADDGFGALAVVSPHRWSDPTQKAELVLRASIAETANVLADAIEAREFTRTLGAWKGALLEAESSVRQHAAQILERQDASLSEPAALVQVHRALPAKAALVLGNSLAVREIDQWVAPGLKDIAVFSQRGVSGIDGLVAGAAGVAQESGRPTCLVVGDVSLLHDIGSLACVEALDAPFVIVVINNGGGRIFEQLPIREKAGAGFDYFVTPHQRDFSHAARFYGLDYARVSSNAELSEALDAGFTKGAPCLIDTVVPGESARLLSQELFDTVDEELRAKG